MNQSIRRGTTAGVAAVLSAAALALSACGSSSDSADESSGDGLGDVTVQFSWIKNAEFAGEFIADSAGYYKDAGLGKATFLAGPVAQEEIVATGKADFGLSNAVSTASAITNSDFPLKIIGATYQKNPFSILSLADQGNIKTPQDLIGKKIGVQDPNLSLYKAFLAANDIDEKDVEIVPNGFDNESLLVKSHGFDTVDLSFADNNLPFVAESIITTDETLEKKPDYVKAFLEAEIKGWKDACDGEAGYEKGAKLAVDTYGKDIDPPLELDKEIAQAKQQCELLVNTDETAKNGIFTISDDLVQANLTSLKAAGIDISADDLFDLEPLNELLKEKPELVQ